MKAVFKTELDKTELEKVEAFCKASDYCSIEQSVGWSNMFYKSKIRFFYLIDDNLIKCFSQINESFRFAHIIFGPVCSGNEEMIFSINEIIDYYRKRGFIYLGIQLYCKSGFDSEYIEYNLNCKHNIKYIFNNDNTKSSIEINLERDFAEIHSQIRENHLRNIKKANKLQIAVDVIKSNEELTSFIDVYSKMCSHRKLHGGSISVNNIHEVYDYLIKNQRGQILIAKDKDNIILGGIILVYQGISVRYFLGASDPDRRELPILHIVLYEAIKRAKAEKFKYFDFWGYNHFADEKNQVFYINHFKKGFGGYYTFFAKKMNINLIPFGYNIYISLSVLKKIFKKITIN